MAIKLKDKIKILISNDWATISIMLSQLHSGLLVDEGWINSFKLKKAVDKNLRPIPWTTYSFIDFIKPRLFKSLSVFEFGSGNSTYFFSEKVKQVISVEHSESWYNELLISLPSNVKIILESNVDKYSSSIYGTQNKFDIILIDGIVRNECIESSINSVTDKGVIILDDSERDEYTPGKAELLGNGFRYIEFWGIAPGILFKKCTTIYYKENNCLGI